MIRELEAKKRDAEERLAKSKAQYQADLAEVEELTQLSLLLHKHLADAVAEPEAAASGIPPFPFDEADILVGADAIDAIVYVLRNSEDPEMELATITEQMQFWGWTSSAANPVETTAMAIRRLGADRGIVKIRRGVYALIDRLHPEEIESMQLDLMHRAESGE